MSEPRVEEGCHVHGYQEGWAGSIRFRNRYILTSDALLVRGQSLSRGAHLHFLNGYEHWAWVPAKTFRERLACA